MALHSLGTQTMRLTGGGGSGGDDGGVGNKGLPEIEEMSEKKK